MRYSEFLERDHYTKQELIAMAKGKLVEDPPAGGMGRLPSPPFLMFDRVTKVERDGRKGTIVSEQDIVMDAWYFQCHFVDDPVQPGCLGVDALWQLLGFYCTVNGAIGSGRALGCGQVEFQGQIRPYDKTVRYEIDVRRFTNLKDSGSSVAIGNGRVFVDDQLVYLVADLKVGIFTDIAYDDYPNPHSPHARGGIITR